MQNVVMLSLNVLSVIYAYCHFYADITFFIIMLGVDVQNVVMLSVVVLIVGAPLNVVD